MIEEIAKIILNKQGYEIINSSPIILRQDSDYKVCWEIGKDKTFTLYKDGYWEITDLLNDDIILEGKVTSPVNKYWIKRLVGLGFSDEYAYAIYLDWKRI